MLRQKKLKIITSLEEKNYWDYDIKRLSLNYRLSDINCALGIAQLKKINLFLKKRKKSYIYYKKNFEKLDCGISLPSYKSFKDASYHLFNKHRFCKY